ncbi:MaoC family dehydratase N-terminal domain-containing protein [Frankia sp. AgPm24]|nr:MaoC family dehydratase N-terminal domain-containing protein [Frankia sp. AgPm24]
MTEFSFPVEAGQIMLFARAVGDPNPAYSDPVAAAESEAGSIIAPPTFVQSGAHYNPDWTLRPMVGEPWFGSGRTPTGTAQPAPHSGGLHAEQHFEYHRHIRPGDVLTVTLRSGKAWEKVGRRGGRLRFEETISEYRDAKGELIITSRNIIVRPEHTVDAEESA